MGSGGMAGSWMPLKEFEGGVNDMQSLLEDPENKPLWRRSNSAKWRMNG